MNESELDIDIRQYLAVLRRYLHLVLGIGLIAALMSGVISLRMPKTYEAAVLMTFQGPETGGLVAPSETVFSRAANLDTLIHTKRVQTMALEELRRSGMGTMSAAGLGMVAKTRPLGDIVKLSVRGSTPGVAAAAANALAAAVVENDLNLRRANARAARLFISNQLQSAQELLSKTEQALEAFRARQRRNTGPKLPAGSSVEEGQLQREVRLAEASYVLLSQKLQEARIAEASIAPSLTVLQPAEVPSVPIRPRVTLNVLLALLLGLMAGGGAAFLAESMDETLRDGDEAERLAGAPVLAELPYLPRRSRQDSNGRVGLVLLNDPQSLQAESYRLLRSAVIFAAVRQKVSALMITSPGPEHGKTTIAANLSIGMALAGKQTSLIEADLRRPQLDALFSPNQGGPTLLELLGDSHGPVSLQPTQVPKLAWLPAGGPHPESTELLSSGQFARIVEELRRNSDFVVVDAPPILAVSDALILARSLDALLLVIELGETTRSELRQTMKRIEHGGVRLLGVVLNKVRMEHADRYYQTYYRHSSVPSAVPAAKAATPASAASEPGHSSRRTKPESDTLRA